MRFIMIMVYVLSFRNLEIDMHFLQFEGSNHPRFNLGD